MAIKELEKIKEIYLSSDVDDEDYQENLQKITEWESSLRQNEDFASWLESDVTKSILEQAKTAYRDFAMTIMAGRDLTDAQRASLFAKQDAALWLISLIDKDTKGAVKQILTEIRRALNP